MQVSALRTAISYIKSLQTLVADCDAGRLGEQVYSESRALDSLTNQRPVSRSHDPPAPETPETKLEFDDLFGF